MNAYIRGWLSQIAPHFSLNHEWSRLTRKKEDDEAAEGDNGPRQSRQRPVWKQSKCTRRSRSRRAAENCANSCPPSRPIPELCGGRRATEGSPQSAPVLSSMMSVHLRAYVLEDGSPQFCVSMFHTAYSIFAATNSHYGLKVLALV